MPDNSSQTEVPTSKRGRPSSLLPEVRQCEVCEKDFETKVHPVTGSVARGYPSRFCSRQCSRKDDNSGRGDASRAVYESAPKMCPCGQPIPYEKRHIRQFCSIECRKKYAAKRPRDEDNWLTKICRNCGKEFEIRRSSRSPGHYCSNECANRHTKTTKHYAVDGFDIVFESSYEAFVWGALKIVKMPVERFDRRFTVNGYGPDLWLPTKKLAIECKGMVDSNDEAKWAAFREHGKLLVLTRSDLLTLSPDALLAML